MVNKIYNKIIPILVLTQPLFDVITSFMMKVGYSVTIGVLIKITLIFLSVIYLLFIDNSNKKMNYLYLIILFIFSVLNIMINVDIIKVQFFAYFNYMVKFIYLIVMLLYFIKWFKNGNSIKLYQFRIPILIILISFILSMITDTAVLSYDAARRGISGWYNSANEFGALLCLFFPISLFNAFHNKEGKKIDYILFIACGIMLLMVGTKVGLLGYIITLLVYIMYRFITIRKKKLDYKFLISVIVLILPLLFWQEIPAVYNTQLKIDKYNLQQNIEENVGTILLSGRDEFTKNMQSNRTNIEILQALVGKSYLRNDGMILIVEQDLLDVYYMYGIVGVLILLVLFAYVLYAPIKYFIFDLKRNVYNVKSVFCIVSILLVIAVSYISGHVLLSPSVSTYLILVMVILYDKCVNKTQELTNKLIIYMPKLSVGGMEQALINLLNMSDFIKKYQVDLYLGYSIEKKYLENVPKEVNVNLLCKGKWNLISKIFTGLKMVATYINLLINPYKYDVSICYAYQHGILAKLARLSSKNNIIFIHNDLLKCRTKEELKKLKKKVRFDKFSKIVCVSNGAKKSFQAIYPNYTGKIITINNYINGQKILNLSTEKINDIKKINKTTFINIGRHEEKAKKITRILESSKKLLKEKYDFRVILIGDGEDHNLYVNLIKKYKLEKNIILLGKKINPYPYLKMSDCFILSSEYEGYGLVLDESRILNVPIISTDVADAKEIMNDGYGILCKNTSDGIYFGMKQFLEKGYKVKKQFDYHKFNGEITKKLNKIVVGDKNEESNVYF